jgi:hypothetical protein
MKNLVKAQKGIMVKKPKIKITGPKDNPFKKDAPSDTTKIKKYQKGGTMKKMKTGGMVNSNTKVQADNTPGSKGVKSGINPKAAASKVARGKVGGTSTAPKGAFPKAKMKGSKKS